MKIIQIATILMVHLKFSHSKNWSYYFLAIWNPIEHHLSFDFDEHGKKGLGAFTVMLVCSLMLFIYFAAIGSGVPGKI